MLSPEELLSDLDVSAAFVVFAINHGITSK
jgi:hypothetical protein